MATILDLSKKIKHIKDKDIPILIIKKCLSLDNQMVLCSATILAMNT